VSGGVLVLTVAATLGAVVALDLVDPACTPPGVVNLQVNLRATRFVVAAVLFAVEVTKRSKSGAGWRMATEQKDDDMKEGNGEWEVETRTGTW